MEPLTDLHIDEGPVEEILDEEEEDDEDEDFDPTLEEVQDEDDEEDDEEEASSSDFNIKVSYPEEISCSITNIREDDVSKRTRSKAKPTDLEEDKKEPLDFPDFSTDLYAPDDQDPVYIDFLNGLFAEDLNDLDLEENDDENDPEFSIKTDERSRSGPKSIAKHEIDFLELESRVDYESPDITAWTSVISEEHALQLRFQMAQHVQLLTQRYLTCMEYAPLVPYAEDAKLTLLEINQLRHEKETSSFNCINLKPALALIETNSLKNCELKNLKCEVWRVPSLSLQTKLVISKNPQVFIFPELIPSNGFHHPSKHSKVEFTAAEDCLIALGIDQFKALNRSNYMKFISQLLLPCKTASQIKVHIKNARKRGDENNPIRVQLRGDELNIDRKFYVLKEKNEFDEVSKCPGWLASFIKPQPLMLSSNKKLAMCYKDTNVPELTVEPEPDDEAELTKDRSQPWTHDDDKQIIELIKRKLAAGQEELGDVFLDVAKSLSRDADAVYERFSFLMQILKTS